MDSRMLVSPWTEEEGCGQKAFGESHALLISFYNLRSYLCVGLSSNLNGQEEILL